MPDPRVRRRARERALQFLFGLDFTQYAWDEVVEDFWDTHPSRASVRRYANKLIKGVSQGRDALDEAITGALDRWSPERVGRVEWNILRMALYEMRHRPDVPTNVALNEAIEIAKAYGAEESPRFVNGVLDRLRTPEPDASGDGE
ncbi:MAG: transcription antitermination factor NusB [Nitrospiraceae bacterium]|nr:transcription antitermination factor NusB [Nitrospiraceae bacterium]